MEQTGKTIKKLAGYIPHIIVAIICVLQISHTAIYIYESVNYERYNAQIMDYSEIKYTQGSDVYTQDVTVAYKNGTSEKLRSVRVRQDGFITGEYVIVLKDHGGRHVRLKTDHDFVNVPFIIGLVFYIVFLYVRHVENKLTDEH